MATSDDDSKATKTPHAVLQAATEKAVRGWIGHSALRAAVESEGPGSWREGVAALLLPLEAKVGVLDQKGISWLMLRAMRAQAWPPEGAEWADTYDPPTWANDPEVLPAAARLLYVVTKLAIDLKQKGVPLDPKSIADRVVMAQLVQIEVWPWNDPDEMIAKLNVASIGSVVSDGSSTAPDLHAGDREERPLNTLRRTLQDGRIRTYTKSPGIYDQALLASCARKPDATLDSIMKALKDVEPWVSELQELYKGRDPGDFRRTIRLRLKHLRESGSL